MEQNQEAETTRPLDSTAGAGDEVVTESFRAPQPPRDEKDDDTHSSRRHGSRGSTNDWARKQSKTTGDSKHIEARRVPPQLTSRKKSDGEALAATPVPRQKTRTRKKDDKLGVPTDARQAGGATGIYGVTSDEVFTTDDTTQLSLQQEELRPGAFAVDGIGGREEMDLSVVFSERDEETQLPLQEGSTAVDGVLVDAELVDAEAERQKYILDAEAQLRSDILAEAAEAEVVDPAIAKRRKRRRWAIGIVLFIAAGVGGLMAGLFASRSSSADVPPTSAPSASASPSFQPTFSPSAAPTVFHDECQDAEMVTKLPFFDSGVTDLAQELGDDNSALTCPMISGFDRGVWRTVQGTGRCLSASAIGTNFDAVIAVYVGTCEELLCVTRSEDVSSPVGEATWFSQVDETYYVLVAGADAGTGDYTLTITDAGIVCNNECEEPVPVNSFPFSFSGDTVGSPVVDPNGGALSCFLDLVNPTTAGMWFEIIGSGTCITASTAGSELDTILAVYDGDCDSLQCLTGNSEARPDRSSEVLFFAERDRRYRILVAGAAFAGRGNFDLVISEDADRECGDHGFICNLEINLDVQSCIFAREESFPFNSTQSFLIATCQDAPFSEPTPDNCGCVVVIGEIDNFQLTNLCPVCSFLPQADTSDGEWSISFDCSNVLTGPCVGRDENGDCISNGNATIPPPTNEYSCENATVADQLPFFETGNVQSLELLLSDFDALACPTIFPGRSARWYRVTGTGSCIRASTEGSTFDTVLSVYSGECGSVTCLRESDDTAGGRTSETEWLGLEGETYYVLLSSFGTVFLGDYNLDITEFDCSSNEPCGNAALVSELPFFASGNTVDLAVVDPSSPTLACSVVEQGARGTWYTATAVLDTFCITISTEGSRFDTVLAVYHGGCTNLTCVVENNDSSSLVRSSEVSWTAGQFVTFYVFVGGVGNFAGDFVVSAMGTPGACT